MLVDVVVEPREGVMIYKDYFPHEKDAPLPELKPGEAWKRMTATALMVLYETENSII